jgi:hypothetical protein
MAFTTKKLSSDKSIDVTQLNNKFYAKIKHQPFEQYLVVCEILFTDVGENTIKDITIYNPSGRISDIINMFNYLDRDGNDTLTKETKDVLFNNVLYSQYESSQTPYYQNIGFCFGYH